MPKATVIVIAYNEEKNIRTGITSILSQTIKDFELIIVDDGSTDDTTKIVRVFSDKRIRLIKNGKNEGYASARNMGLDQATSDYIFFTDADCIPSKNWIEEGLKSLKNKGIAWVGGKTVYSYTNSVTFKQEACSTTMTCNIAYKKYAIKDVGGFDLEYNDGHEDLALKFKLYQKGYKAIKNPKMVVFHKKKDLSLKILCNMLRRNKSLVRLFKKDKTSFERLGLKFLFYKNICMPNLLVISLCPPIFFFYGKENRKIKNLPYFLVLYAYSLAVRLTIWKAAVKERVFVI